VRSIFQEAQQKAPSIIFFDEFDAIAGSKEKAQKEMEKRIVSEFISCLDKLEESVFVLVATSRPDSLE
jgi:SpoVK/Ycf46/Vps4 family AAA+-type ATPase